MRRLKDAGLTYPCFCTRAELHAASAPHASDGTPIYRGACRSLSAEELARRDLDYQPVSKENYDELVARMDDYIAEFEAHGTDNILISTMDEPDV